jgi:subtilisin family serine protease
VRQLRALDPAGQYDVDPIYFPSGVDAAPSPLASRSRSPAAGGVRIGLLDGAADTRSPALARAHIIQRTFAPGAPEPSPHATAIASLLAGEDGDFRGAAPGASLFVADVYGSTAAGGSAVAVVRGLAWLVDSGVAVINVSLVGPPNALLQAAVSRAVVRGRVIVAAVGNDGPAAPPLYPAAYPGVVGVTGLDARLRVLPEAERGPQVAFAAPGAEMVAAAPRGGYTAVRGTSYAAPLVAGLLARRLPQPDPAAARRVVESLARGAVDLGPKGRDAIYGWGGVALDLPVRPAALARR